MNDESTQTLYTIPGNVVSRSDFGAFMTEVESMLGDTLQRVHDQALALVEEAMDEELTNVYINKMSTLAHIGKVRGDFFAEAAFGVFTEKAWGPLAESLAINVTKGLSTVPGFTVKHVHAPAGIA